MQKKKSIGASPLTQKGATVPLSAPDKLSTLFPGGVLQHRATTPKNILKYFTICALITFSMSIQSDKKNNNHFSWPDNPSSPQKRVDVNDLVSKMNEDKKRDRKNSIILGAAAVSAVTVFGIILTL